jgi:hypothetical protein
MRRIDLRTPARARATRNAARRLSFAAVAAIAGIAAGAGIAQGYDAEASTAPPDAAAKAAIRPGSPADRPPLGPPPPLHAPAGALAPREPFPTFMRPPGAPVGTPIAPLGASATADSTLRITWTSPFAAGCDGLPLGGAFSGGEVEPYVAIDPRDPSHLIAAWQQDRAVSGGARGIRIAYSLDGGATWSLAQAAFSHCTGGSAANGGDYLLASDPWVAIGPDGIAYQIAIAFNGGTFAAGSSNAVLASRSLDGGRTWSPPATLIQDGSAAFNDKESITADPVAPGVAYATWDRLEPGGNGPSYFTRTTDGGRTWEGARPIHDPGGRNQTLNNQIIVRPIGGGDVTLFDFFTEFELLGNAVVPHLAFVRSADRGVTWSAAVQVSDLRAVGTRDPEIPSRELRDGANLASFASGPDGLLVGVWQDSRFSGGGYDGIAFSRSLDGGATWSAPVQINRAAHVPALLPAVTIRDDGVIGVLYYDLRSNTADPASLLVDVWLTTSRDGLSWSERHVAGPFDFNRAPLADGGLFLGDYQGLTGANGVFAAVYAQTNPDPVNRTDVFASLIRSVDSSANADVASKSAYRALDAKPLAVTPAWEARLTQSAAKTLRQRPVGPLR